MNKCTKAHMYNNNEMEFPFSSDYVKTFTFAISLTLNLTFKYASMLRIYVSCADVCLRKHISFSAKLWKLKAGFYQTFRHRPIDFTSCSRILYASMPFSMCSDLLSCNSTKYAVYLRRKVPVSMFRVLQVAKNFALAFVIRFDVFFGCQMSSESFAPIHINPFKPTSSIHKICKVNAIVRKQQSKFGSVAHYRGRFERHTVKWFRWCLTLGYWELFQRKHQALQT